MIAIQFEKEQRRAAAYDGSRLAHMRRIYLKRIRRMRK